ncbi:MAG: hypothetical protein HZA37_01715 [Parcubacteria group bacterium]|nr:hypothetical protein [Parcubacteria group bacterium]
MLDKIINKLKEPAVKKTIYPILSGIIAVFIVSVFAYAVWFLSFNVNRIFKPIDKLAESRMAKVDKESFNVVAKKLGFSLLE